MKKQLEIIGIVALLVCVGLSGCTQKSNNSETSQNDNQIQLISYQLTKYKNFTYDFYTEVNNSLHQIFNDSNQVKIPENINISDIDSNLTKKEQICNQFIAPSLEHTVEWDSDYNGYSFEYLSIWQAHTSLSNFHLSNDVAYWRVNGIVKNTGNSYLNTFVITVNFYNSNGTLISYENIQGQGLPSGYTWNFEVKYDGLCKNDVNHVDFKFDIL